MISYTVCHAYQSALPDERGLRVVHVVFRFDDRVSVQKWVGRHTRIAEFDDRATALAVQRDLNRSLR